MGKLVKICAAMALILCASAAAFAENYVEIDRHGTNIVYIDTDSIVDEGGYVVANSKVAIRTKEGREKFKEHSGVEAHYLYLKFAYNKEAEQDQFLSASAVYGWEEVDSQSREFADGRWRDIPQGTLGEKVHNWVINYAAQQE